MTHAAPLLAVEGLSKRFPGVVALDGVSLELARGEVLAVIGENGAGKSTLMKILAGVEQPDAGQIRIEGQSVAFDDVAAALAHGVVLIHQELNLAGNLDAAANLFLGREPSRWGVIDRRRLVAESRSWLERVGLNVSPQTIVDRLPIGQQQLIEIAKAFSARARILIMDEPTSSLTSHETEQLFRVIRGLQAEGVGIIYISHRLAEVRTIADRVVALRDGRNSGGLARDEIHEGRMVSLMVGREPLPRNERAPRGESAAILDIRGLVTPAHPRHTIDLQVGRGEIVGLAGLVGAGRTELLTTLFGITPALAGSIRLRDRAVAIRSPGAAIEAGLALVPEDRKQQGLILEMAVRENISLASLNRPRRPAGLLDLARERTNAATMIDRLGIKTPHAGQAVQLLSGGNQQKAVLAKWLLLEPVVLLLDEPTRGVDVGAKAEIYRLIEQLAEQGTAIILASSELPEVLALSDRVVVMHEGRQAAQFPRAGLSEETIMAAATGQTASPTSESRPARTRHA